MGKHMFVQKSKKFTECLTFYSLRLFRCFSRLNYKHCKQDKQPPMLRKFPTNLRLYPTCSLRLRLHCKLNFANIIEHFRSQNRTFLCRNQTFACSNPTSPHISVHYCWAAFTLYILNFVAAFLKQVNSRKIPLKLTYFWILPAVV